MKTIQDDSRVISSLEFSDRDSIILGENNVINIEAYRENGEIK